MLHLIYRFRFLYLFIVLIFFFLIKAIGTQFGLFRLSDQFFSIIFIVSIFIIGQRIRALITTIALLFLAIIILNILALYVDSIVIAALRLLIMIGFLTVMTGYCFYFTLQDKTISITTLFGPICCYLFIGLIFSNIFLLIEVLSPPSFVGLEAQNEAKAIYFSFITLTSVGYGEIIPVKSMSQLFTWLEAVTGQLYIAIIIGQLVGRYGAERHRLTH
jgi:voltage-gated potassium channel